MLNDEIFKDYSSEIESKIRKNWKEIRRYVDNVEVLAVLHSAILQEIPTGKIHNYFTFQNFHDFILKLEKQHLKRRKSTKAPEEPTPEKKVPEGYSSDIISPDFSHFFN